jgi:hypothetical protein
MVSKKFIITDPISIIHPDDWDRIPNEGYDIGSFKGNEGELVYIHKIIKTAYGDGRVKYNREVICVNNAMLCIAYTEAGWEYGKGIRFSTIQQALKALPTIFIRHAMDNSYEGRYDGDKEAQARTCELIRECDDLITKNKYLTEAI